MRKSSFLKTPRDKYAIFITVSTGTDHLPFTTLRGKENESGPYVTALIEPNVRIIPAAKAV